MQSHSIDSEDGERKLLPNVGNYWPTDITSYPRRPNLQPRWCENFRSRICAVVARKGRNVFTGEAEAGLTTISCAKEHSCSCLVGSMSFRYPNTVSPIIIITPDLVGIWMLHTWDAESSLLLSLCCADFYFHSIFIHLSSHIPSAWSFDVFLCTVISGRPAEWVRCWRWFAMELKRGYIFDRKLWLL
jgi:hypothetical protein